MVAYLESLTKSPMTDAVFDLWVRITTFFGVGAAAIGGITLTSWLSVLGVLIAFLTLLVNWWHKRQMIMIERDRLDREFPRIEQKEET